MPLNSLEFYICPDGCNISPGMPHLPRTCPPPRSLLGITIYTPYSPVQTNITNFPYASCDNDLGHSPLRLGLATGGVSPVVAHSDGTLTYCWSVTQTSGTQCDTNPNGLCCHQDLTAVYFEISEKAGGTGSGEGRAAAAWTGCMGGEGGGFGNRLRGKRGGSCGTGCSGGKSGN